MEAILNSHDNKIYIKSRPHTRPLFLCPFLCYSYITILLQFYYTVEAANGCLLAQGKLKKIKKLLTKNILFIYN